MKNCGPQKYDPYSFFSGNWNAWQNEYLDNPTIREVASFSETAGGSGHSKLPSRETAKNSHHFHSNEHSTQQGPAHAHTHTHTHTHTRAQWEVGSTGGNGMWKAQRYTLLWHWRTLVLRGYFIKRFNLTSWSHQKWTCFPKSSQTVRPRPPLGIDWCCLSRPAVMTIFIFAIYKADCGLLEVHQMAL